MPGGDFYDQDAPRPTPRSAGGRRARFYDQDEDPWLEAVPDKPSRLRVSSRSAPVWTPDSLGPTTIPPGAWGPPVDPDRPPDPDAELEAVEVSTEAPARRAAPAPEPPAAGSAEPPASPGPPVRAAPPPRPAPRPTTPDRRPPPPKRGAQSVGRATAVLAAGTFASRVTGFVRVLVIGYVLGVGSLSDAFNYANGIPNIVYDLLLGGILSATLVPVFVEQFRAGSRTDRHRSVSAVFTAIAAGLLVISGLLWLLAPEVIRFYLVLNSTSAGPAERDLATRLLRWFSPQVFFLGATVTSTALLNARRRFTAAAVSPVVNNLVAIAALIATKVVAERLLTNRALSPPALLSSFTADERAVVILGAGTTAGYLLQLLVQWPAMRRSGIRIRPVWEPRHPAVRRVATLSSWLVGVVVANQISLAVVMVLAGRVQGGVTAYQFSYQFFQLPYALIAVSVASAIMPDLSERWTAGDRVGFERQFVTGLRVTLALLLPLALIYMAVGHPFIQLAIHHGRVSGSGAHLVASTLVAFAAGLPGFSAFFLLMRAYQAMQDARTMFWIYVLENALTVVLAVALSPAFGIPGLAVAWVGPYTVASFYAVVRLRGRVGSLGGWLTVRALMRVILASTVAAVVAVAVGLPLAGPRGEVFVALRVLVQSGAGLLVYVYLGRVLAIRELRPVITLARRFTRR